MNPNMEADRSRLNQLAAHKATSNILYLQVLIYASRGRVAPRYATAALAGLRGDGLVSPDSCSPPTPNPQGYGPSVTNGPRKGEKTSERKPLEPEEPYPWRTVPLENGTPGERYPWRTVPLENRTPGEPYPWRTAQDYQTLVRSSAEWLGLIALMLLLL
ncbi:unnamed protein product [Arctogadus glacialis]